MMLKNRLTALVAVAAIAVPAIALAASKYSKDDGKPSFVNVGCKAVGLTFTAKADPSNIKVDDDGTTIKVSIDGTKLKTDNEGRDTHMKEKVFNKGKTVLLTVTHADLNAKGKIPGCARRDKEDAGVCVKATVKFSDKPAKPVVITNVTLANGIAKGHIDTLRSELGVPEACFSKVGPCVKDELEIDAAIHVKTQ